MFGSRICVGIVLIMVLLVWVCLSWFVYWVIIIMIVFCLWVVIS